MQMIGNCLCLGCCGDNSAFVGLQDGQLSAAAHNAKEGNLGSKRSGFLTAFLRIISLRNTKFNLASINAVTYQTA
ncbi:hypothetical protein EDF68_1275 [Ochrobactrum sp. BH3]|nr:hypothetical protein EDF68_1275 [Ochrobactrum sp. BH3]